MAEKLEKSDKEKALEALNKRPENFRWTVEGVTLIRSVLIEGVNTGIPAIIDLAKDLGEPATANQLGKRYRCLVCETELLATKPGAGMVSCCGQNMEVREPRPLPSSD